MVTEEAVCKEPCSQHITRVPLRPDTLEGIILNNKGTNLYLFLLCDKWLTVIKSKCIIKSIIFIMIFIIRYNIFIDEFYFK